MICLLLSYIVSPKFGGHGISFDNAESLLKESQIIEIFFFFGNWSNGNPLASERDLMLGATRVMPAMTANY